MNGPKETLMQWLNDAYGMERQQIEVLESHAKHAQDRPEIRQGIERHHEETQRQVERVSECIERLGGKPSTTKSAMGKMMGMVQGPATGAARDELVKDALVEYAAEHFEIASYRALVESSRRLGEDEIARVCEEILQEEERMADWVEQNLPGIVADAISAEPMPAR